MAHFVPNPEAWVLLGEMGYVSCAMEIVRSLDLGLPLTLARTTFIPLFFTVLASLVLLVLEAGIDIDVATLKLTGTRGCIIAIIGSLLPIGIGVGTC